MCRERHVLSSPQNHTPAERRAIYALLTPTVQRNLWREHIHGLLDAGLQLRVDERLELDEILLRFDEYVGNPVLARANHERDSLEARVKRTFDAQTAALLFASLGETADSVSLAPMTAASAYPACDCSTSSSYCMLFNCERGGWTDCIPQNGCGLFWCYVCDGECTSRVEE